MMKTFRPILTVMLAVLVSPLNIALAAGGTAKPNIILILADDLGYDCIGANGGQTYKTPELDQMAQRGMRFEHCYAQPLCTPSRVQIMTGTYNVRNYVTFGLLEQSQTTFAHLLKKAGYVTCMAGKWQLGGEGSRMCELARHFGFDESYLCSWYAYYWNPTVVINGTVKDYRQEDYGPDVVNDLACRFLEQNKARPYFLYYTMSLPHDPFLPTPDSGVREPWRFGDNPEKKGPKGTPDMFKKGDPKYFGHMVAYMDKLVGRLLARLDELGLRDNTLVLFTGDNGSPVGEALLHDRKVRAGKGHMTDAGTHVPLIVRWPAGIRQPGVSTDLVDFSDFLPTLCDAAGAEVPAELKVDGRSFLPHFAASPALRGHGVIAGTPSTLSTRHRRNGLAPSGTSFIDRPVLRYARRRVGRAPAHQPCRSTSGAHGICRHGWYRDARPAPWAAKEKQSRTQKGVAP